LSKPSLGHCEPADRSSQTACNTGAGEPAVTARRSFGRLADAMRVNTEHYDYYFLCPELRHKRMTPMIARVRARSLAEAGELLRHCGEEYIYVLSGVIAVHTAFYDPVVLKSGESIYVDSSMGHACVTEGCEEATILAICSSRCTRPQRG
jgi:mannose-6-phosphate isomerase-like protein (cupin superfamily)